VTPLDAAWFESAARRLKRRHSVAVFLAGLTAGFLSAAVILKSGQSLAVALAVALAVGLLVAFIVFPRHRRLITAAAMARHVNRTTPDAEESAELLLSPPEALLGLARLQRRRVAERLGGLADAPALPAGVYRGLLRAAALMALAAVFVLILPVPGGATGIFEIPSDDAPGHSGSDEAPSIRTVSVSIEPPAYTGRPARRGESWELEAEEGARLIWSMTTSGPAISGRLITAAGDTIALKAVDGQWTAILTAVRSTLYRVHLDHTAGDPVASDDYRLLVRPDAPPVVTILHPERRTLIQPGAPLRLDVEVLARDDYGVDSTAIVATVSKGQGEGVKFREQRLGFTTRERRDGRGLLLRRFLDLAALGLEPGDELYFQVIATDRRAPVPNEARSETIFITLVDSARATAGPGTGVALDVAPDYFRSQRQLIIDTEKLLQDQRRLSSRVFTDRSNGLGIDQGLLRLRYGQFMGDEFDGAIPTSGREAHADDHAEDRTPPTPPRAGDVVIPDGPRQDLMAALRHEHDDPENATLLAPQVKEKLRQAITQMWSAERHLRVGEPRRSLPFQHRALELLQEIRQNARSYVQRVGFEPPPLEPDRKRLTADLSEVRAPVIERSATWREADPALREGLRRLQRLRAGGIAEAEDPARLETLGQELARRAVEDAAWLLEPLRALRLGIASLTGDSARCHDCLAAAERGVRRALGQAEPTARAARRPALGLVERYRQRLLAPR